jgi:hypothetical protein
MPRISDREFSLGCLPLPQKFPYRDQKPYIPPQRKGVKAMTIAAGFRCKDGVVLCADTEVTIPGWLKFRGSKIRTGGWPTLWRSIFRVPHPLRSKGWGFFAAPHPSPLIKKSTGGA